MQVPISLASSGPALGRTSVLEMARIVVLVPARIVVLVRILVDLVDLVDLADLAYLAYPLGLVDLEAP